MKDRPTWAAVNDAFYKYLVQPNALTQFEKNRLDGAGLAAMARGWAYFTGGALS